MKPSLFVLFLISYSIQLTVASLYKRDYKNRLYYTVHSIQPSDINAVKQLAHHVEGRFEGQVGELNKYFWISLPITQKRNILSTIDESLFGVDKVEMQLPSAHRLFKRVPPPPSYKDPVTENKNEEYRLNGDRPIIQLPSLNETNGYQKMKDLLGIHDPGFEQQWHLVNQVQRGYDLNVTGVWSQGITGKGIVVAILDDGLDMDHLDLKENYASISIFAEGSYDFNSHVASPKPKLVDDTHGTRCAGEIAAAKNDICGLGVAYDAKVAGIRILSAEITEADEAAALNYEYQKNHIYSCSWGPSDFGEVAEAPQGILLDAIKNGVRSGRNGTGSIFVFASGNGGANDDNCNFDGYTNSIYTVTVGAIDREGKHPYYSERCSAQLLVTYSSGSGGYIFTTDTGGGDESKCTDRHRGTSAAAPLAAGVFALVLSARPELTWRDIQYLCVYSAVPISLEDNEWSTLPSGRMFNHKFGYGALDAYRIVEMAKDFVLVGPQTNISVISSSYHENEKLDIPDITPTNSTGSVKRENAFASTLKITQDMLNSVGWHRLEHVTATVNIEHQRRGDLEILLESPNGVSSQLGAPRKNDYSTKGFVNWTFMTVKHWEEAPIGDWTLRIIDAKNPEYTGKFLNWKLTLWGEVSKGFKPPIVNEGSEKSDDKDLEDFNKETDNSSYQSPLSQSKQTRYWIYGVSMAFVLATLGSTAFIVKKYILIGNSNSMAYSRPNEEDAYEFENLLSTEHDNRDDMSEHARDSIENF